MLSATHREQGFTLFEALVASLLLGMLGLGVLSFVEGLETERRQAAAGARSGHSRARGPRSCRPGHRSDACRHRIPWHARARRIGA